MLSPCFEGVDEDGAVIDAMDEVGKVETITKNAMPNAPVKSAVELGVSSETAGEGGVGREAKPARRMGQETLRSLPTGQLGEKLKILRELNGRNTGCVCSLCIVSNC